MLCHGEGTRTSSGHNTPPHRLQFTLWMVLEYFIITQTLKCCTAKHHFLSLRTDLCSLRTICGFGNGPSWTEVEIEGVRHHGMGPRGLEKRAHSLVCLLVNGNAGNGRDFLNFLKAIKGYSRLWGGVMVQPVGLGGVLYLLSLGHPRSLFEFSAFSYF